MPIKNKELLNHPEVMKATSNVNQELLERRAYRPPVCDVFKKNIVFLKPLKGIPLILTGRLKNNFRA